MLTLHLPLLLPCLTCSVDVDVGRLCTVGCLWKRLKLSNQEDSIFTRPLVYLSQQACVFLFSIMHLLRARVQRLIFENECNQCREQACVPPVLLCDRSCRRHIFCISFSIHKFCWVKSRLTKKLLFFCPNKLGYHFYLQDITNLNWQCCIICFLCLCLNLWYERRC